MNIIIVFLLGLLLGWLIEWVIDWLYWRKRLGGVAGDNLTLIKGIGPIIAKKLNKADINTYEKLGQLTSTDLENILGNDIRRLADEKSILAQARDLALEKARGTKTK